MVVLELIPWVISFIMLGAMFYLATIAFRAGEHAGHHESVRLAEKGEASPVYIKQFFVKKRYDDSSRFDVTLVAAAALPA